jgi:DNA polymerase-3 subunit delta
VKVAPRNIEAFLRKPGPEIAAILIYGPDIGLVRERGDRMVESIAGGLDDPFRVSNVTLAALREEPSRLRDEAEALTFGGGRRAVRLRDAADSAADAVELLLSSTTSAGVAVLEAGDLPSRSSLRKLFEAAANAAAVPCYRDDGEELGRLIQQTLRAAGLQPQRDALAYLTTNLGGDRGLTRQELAKLVTYMGPSSVGEVRPVTLADAEACIGDSSDTTMDDLVFALGIGKLSDLEGVADRVLAEGVNPIQLLRALSRHFLRLQLVTGGGEVEGAIARLRPPVFFQRVPQLKAQAKRWRPPAVAAALERLLQAEMQCKRSGWPVETIVRRAVLDIAQLPGRP